MRSVSNQGNIMESADDALDHSKWLLLQTKLDVRCLKQVTPQSLSRQWCYVLVRLYFDLWMLARILAFDVMSIRIPLISLLQGKSLFRHSTQRIFVRLVFLWRGVKIKPASLKGNSFYLMFYLAEIRSLQSWDLSRWYLGQVIDHKAFPATTKTKSPNHLTITESTGSLSTHSTTFSPYVFFRSIILTLTISFAVFASTLCCCIKR